MAVVALPSGKQAVLALTMREFRVLWKDGAVKKIQSLAEDGGDLGDAYPILVKAVAEWDCTDTKGQALDPANLESYDELDPSTFMRLLKGLAEYIAGEDAKN